MERLSRTELKHYLWRVGDLSWKLHSTQKHIHSVVKESNADEILILSSRQLGKSFWATSYAVEFCLLNPGVIVRILAATLKQIQDIVADNLGPICQDAPPGLIERHKSSYRWRIGNSSLRLGPLERANVDYNRGGNASLIICEEGGFVPSDDYKYAITSVIGPQLLRSGGKLVHVTSPSSDPNHIIHTEVLPKTELTNSCFRYTIYDNPQITEAQIEQAKRLCGGEDTAAWQREYLAEIIRDPSIVIVPSFDRSIHVKDFRIPDYCHWQISIDFGGVRDKTVGLIYTYDFMENKVLVWGECLFPANTSTGEIVLGIKDLERQVTKEGHTVTGRWADAPGQLQIDLRNAHGFDIKVPKKDDWQASINNMQVMFGNQQVLIHPRCSFLIQSLESGQYNDKRTDFARTETLGHCDALAALMYALRMLDRSNPFPKLMVNKDSQFFRPKVSDEEKLRESLQPKVFNSNNSTALKRFGSFKAN